jgi:alkylhydroperoxidase/carboxymuconolactone decarboxylase family protein YurZ
MWSKAFISATREEDEMTGTREPDGFHDGLSAEEVALDERFVMAFRAMRESAVRRRALSPRERELIGLAVNAAVTHLYVPAIEKHTRLALEAGASRCEILEVLELSSVLGIHTITIALPVVLEEFAIDFSAPLNERQARLKEDFIARRGGWTELWNSLLLSDEQFFVAYTDFSSVPWENEPALNPKVREFVYVAIDASTTHLLVPGIRAHVQNAIRYGATLDELLEVLEIVSLLGMQTYAEGARALMKIESGR